MKACIAFDGRKCVLCGACVIACMDQNDTDVAAGQRSYPTVAGRVGKCRGCDVRVEAGLLPACVRVCPSGALTEKLKA